MKTVALLIITFILSIHSFGFVALAADPEVAKYVPLVSFPGLKDAGNLNAEQYVQALYTLAISVGALLAVIQIIIAGVQYTLSDVITSKEDAKSRIWGALFGLLIILSAVLILTTVNPNLVKLTIFNNAPSIETILSDEKVQKTACELESLSPECCKSKKGTYIQTGRGGYCSVGTSVPIDDSKGETLEDKRTFCLSAAGREWVEPGECREIGGQQIIIPESKCYDELSCQDWCISAGFEFKGETKTCHRRKI